MQSNEDLLQKIKNTSTQMSKGQKQIAQYILQNYDKAAFFTASKLAHAVGTSESTVVRFAYSLGYDGYPALQKNLQELIKHKLTSVQRIALSEDIQGKDILKTVLKADMNNIRATVDMLQDEHFLNAVAALLQARTVYVLGLRSSTPLAQFFGYYLNYVLDDVRIVSGTIDVYEQLVRIDEQDLCFGISFPRYSTRTIESMKFAKSQNAKVVALTDTEQSPLTLYADATLCAKSTMASFADSLVAPLSVINALIVAVGMEKKEDVLARFDKLETIWNNQGVYVDG